MNDSLKCKTLLLENGFVVIDRIYSDEEVSQILEVIDKADTSKKAFRKSAELFAIRRFLIEIPAVRNLVFTDKLNSLIKDFFGEDYFIVKSIYFDKPGSSNWYVSYHQDLTISVNEKIQLNGFGPWTTKQNQFAVQPPLEILNNIFTIRIHLDETDENNGALKVVAGSHSKGICRPETVDWNVESQQSCNVSKGGAMIMKPLLLHSSCRTTNNKKRRVIHLEFSNKELPSELSWAERFN